MKDEKEITESPEGQDFVTVTAKRLDSDETVETTQAVDPLRSEAEIRNQLGTVVSAFYPEAEFRSYAAAAATYLEPKLLIVAVYCPRDGTEISVEEDEDTQQQLFAA